MSTRPAEVFNLPGGKLGVGAVADITIIDPRRRVEIDPERFESTSRNTPFGGLTLRGGPTHTIVGGEIVWQTS
jgi:dihydroorotase